MARKKEIYKIDAITPQEMWIVGGTSRMVPKKEGEWYIPEGILRRALTIEQARKMRKEIRHIEIASPALAVFGRKTNIEGLNLKVG